MPVQEIETFQVGYLKNCCWSGEKFAIASGGVMEVLLDSVRIKVPSLGSAVFTGKWVQVTPSV